MAITSERRLSTASNMGFVSRRTDNYAHKPRIKVRGPHSFEMVIA